MICHRIFGFSGDCRVNVNVDFGDTDPRLTETERKYASGKSHQKPGTHI